MNSDDETKPKTLTLADPHFLSQDASLYDWTGWLPYSPVNPILGTPVQAQDKKCECGAHVTYGKDCPEEYHVDWCPLYKPK